VLVRVCTCQLARLPVMVLRTVACIILDFMGAGHFDVSVVFTLLCASRHACVPHSQF
jgi:hypothetical protein